MRSLVAAAFLVSGLAGSLSVYLSSVTAATTAPKPVIVVEYDGIIHPVAAEFFDEVMARADTSDAVATVVILRTPGGLLDSTRTIVSRMIASRTPVVVFVAPSGARAASAGFIIAIAADVVAMAPGTHIGAAHPVSAGGGEAQRDETTANKAAADTAAYARTLAAARHRNVTFAAEAVLQSRAFTEREALEANPPLIDLVAADLDDLVRQLDGRSVRRFDGRSITLETSEVTIERMEMTRRQRFLSAIAHPQIAYLLFTLGMLGLTVELWNPGAILPGVVGGLCLLLAFFAFQVLPVNTIGVMLIVFGIALLILEIKVPSYGILGVGGTLALAIGSVMITSVVPGIRVSYTFVVPVALAFAAIFLFLGQLAIKAQRLTPVTGVDGLVREFGETLTQVGPDQPGQIRVHGEIWRATSLRPIEAGHRVRITGMNGLTLLVEPADSIASLN
jgi:membrane-bound serine protease (ClpP class)